MDWESLRMKIASQGMRNSNVLAIAPTATISNIMGKDSDFLTDTPRRVTSSGRVAA